MASEEALARKKKVRAAQTSEPSIGTRIDVDALALLQTNLSAKLTTLEALDKELLELVPAEELEDQLGRADEYSEKIQDG